MTPSVVCAKAFAASPFILSSINNLISSYKSLVKSFTSSFTSSHIKKQSLIPSIPSITISRTSTLSNTSPLPSMTPPSPQQGKVEEKEEVQGLAYSLSLDRSQAGRFYNSSRRDPSYPPVAMHRMPTFRRRRQAVAVAAVVVKPTGLKSCLRNTEAPANQKPRTVRWLPDGCTLVYSVPRWDKLAPSLKKPKRRSRRIHQKKVAVIQARRDAALNVFLSRHLPFSL